MIQAKIIADSICEGHRLTTIEATYPRFIHSELMTYRMLSRGAASSRAIPIEKFIKRVEENPAMPVYWGRNQKGMQAGDELDSATIGHCKHEWLKARDNAVASVRRLATLGLHKQTANRLLEPFMYITTIITGTEWANMFAQRMHPDAQPEFQVLARVMWNEYQRSNPAPKDFGEWHLPYIKLDDIIEVTGSLSSKLQPMHWDRLKAISVGRCARVSYVNQNGSRSLADDIALHDRLKNAKPGHWSPFEHVAQPSPGWGPKFIGNFRYWRQYRLDFKEQNITELPKVDLDFRPCHGCLNDTKSLGNMNGGTFCNSCLEDMYGIDNL